MDVLLSIKSEYVKQIKMERKKFEFRKKVFSKRTVKRVFIYETSPVKKVVGFFTIDDVIEDAPINLWKISEGHAGINYDDYMDYFDGNDIGYAIKIGKIEFFDDPMELTDLLPNGVPPQSFCYLDTSQTYFP
jgi:type I restriction enzyme, S subunit